jgi:hypothetical protein
MPVGPIGTTISNDHEKSHILFSEALTIIVKKESDHESFRNKDLLRLNHLAYVLYQY